MADPGALPILVTGGAGFIGSNFVRQWLAEESSPIVNLDKLSYAGNLDSLADLAADRRYRFVHGDICDRRLVSGLLAEVRPRAIVHFAAESHVDRSIDEAAAFLETNVVGTFRLLDAALGYWESTGRAALFRFLQISTDEVFGSLGPEGRFAETSPYAPNSPYSASKAAADHFARAYHRTYGLPVIVTRCTNNYGPRQFPEKLVPLTILNALEGRPLPVYGDGRNIRDWIHVEDHCRAIRCVLERRARRNLQYRGRLPADEPPGRGDDLRPGGPAPAAAGRRLLPPADRVCPRSAGPRPPLRDRCRENPPRAGLDASRGF